MSESANLNIGSFAVPGTNYGYTGMGIGLPDTQTEYTLAVALLDESGSTGPFAKEMEKAVKEIVKSLRYSPRGDYLLYRHCQFSTGFRELHGFVPMTQLNESTYDNCYQVGGQTALYDSCDRVIAELLDYAKKQNEARVICNGVIYIITDGRDYGSTLSQADVRQKLSSAIASEELESLVTILIGVNPDKGVQADLKKFQETVGFTQYVSLLDAKEATLAKLGNFISKSVSAQSMALGTGGPSKSLTF